METPEPMRAPEAGRTPATDYRAIFDAVSDAILIHEVETGDILDLNRGMCEMFGYSRESAGRLNIADLCGGESQGAQETLKRLIAKTAGGEMQPFEWRAKTSSGQLFWAEVHLKRAILNGKERVLAVIRDISERKQAEIDLKESEARFRLVTEGSLAGVYLIQDGKFRYVNRVLAQIFGYRTEEIIHRLGPLELVHPADRDLIAANIRRRLAREEDKIRYTFRGLRRDGSVVHCEVLSRYLEYQGSPAILGTLLDISERVQAEEALKQSEARYRAIVEHQTELVCRHLPDTTVTFVNEALCRYFGKAREELVGQSFLPSIPEEDWGQVLTALAGLSREKPMAVLEQRVLKADGEVRWQRWTNQVIFDDRGRVLEHQAVGRDVTAQRQTEEALRASEAKYRTLVEQIPAVTYISALDNVTTHIYISPQIEAVLGFSQEEWLANPESFKNRLHPQDRDRVLSELILSYSQGGPFLSEYRMLAKSGRVVWVQDESRAVYDAQGLPLFMQGVALDITARKEAEEALREANSKLQALVQASPLAIVAIDADAKVISWNPAAERIFGWRPHEVLGRPYPIIPGEKKQEFRQLHQRVLRGETIRGLELRRQRRDGSPVEISLSTAPLYDAAGNVGGAMGVIEDITARKRMEEALRKVTRALKAITECHQAMMRATNETELLNEVCRIIVEVGGYRMAWVGYAQQDELKTVRPVAQTGFDAGYVHTIRIRWSDTELGQGPLGEAIRKGKPAICRDTMTDPRFAPWRAEALKRGYASLLALPLKDSQTFGALAIYAPEPNAFDDEEINLLIGLANDLAYGITALRANVERQRAEAALRESEEKYRGLMDYSSDAIFLADLDGNLTAANRRAEELLGYSKKELLQMRYIQIHPPEKVKEICRTFQNIIKVGAGQINETTVQRQDGTQVLVDITGSVIEYAGKKVVQGILRDVTARRKAEEALRESELKLRLLTSQLLTIQERERRRVSRELHDELGQALTVLKIHLVAIENRLRRDQLELKANCEQLLTYIDGVIENVRRLSWDLSPSILEDLGLSSSLGYLIDETCRNHNLSCSLAMDEIDQLFSAETRINIYRIFQESLTNIVKHARATHISVGVKQEGDAASFTIKDNGRGFDQEKVMAREVAKRGLGLTAMNERALMARGSLRIRSQPDQGTQITFQIPVDNN